MQDSQTELEQRLPLCAREVALQYLRIRSRAGVGQHGSQTQPSPETGSGSEDWIQMQTNLQSRHNSVRGLQTKAAPKGSASVATKDESATQAPVEYVYTDELFDKYPPPADMEIDEDDFAELRSELLGQKMGGKLPNTEMLKRYNCVEQYLLYNSYVSYW
ncbi:hypothetical protein WJX77_010408 [Trebouxia sp. C0004]